ncbi:MAG TPA: DHA2 family efflux MFS transporter permease subunit [Comamonas sp.]|uniref:DHA2 family efflux MFS transporter permease subunit n=1 Tax=Comamonas halotolerans TaxID=3041496 RepID=UPI0024E16EA4|nr:DHA2 family efflux MFS transporter permease subunit [Comamonas sp. NoAH]
MSLFAPSPTDALKTRYGEHYRWLLLMALMVGTIASIIPSTSVNVAIPAISDYFHLGQERAQWITSAFMVASTVAMLITPWMLSRFGYRATYAYAIGLLMAGGIAGGIAQHFELLLLSRLAEGVAAGIIQPIPAVIILRAFKPTEQGRAGGMFGMGVVLAPAIAPALGGMLVDWMGWRSTFFMVVPPCLLSLWLAWKFVPTSSPDGTAQASGNKLDVLGLGLVTVGTLGMLNALVAFHHNHVHAAFLLAISLLCLIGFVMWQRRLLHTQRKPLMDLRLFAYKPFVMGCIVAFIYGTAMFGSTYLLPLFIQMGMGLSASYAGNLLLPAGIVLAITIPLVGRMADKQPTHWLVSIGMLLLAISFGLMLWAGPSMALWLLASFIVVGRVGLGFILPSLNLGAMRPLDKALIAQGASTISFIRMLGGAIGVGLCGIVLEWRLAVQAANPSLTDLQARVAAFHESFVMLTVLCLLAFAAATQLRSPSSKTAS